jgi:hypothetical protein
MSKIVETPYKRSVADTVTYAIVGGIFVLGVLAFIFLQ